ncbi:hypothetical protein ACFPRL_07120 [Pseudoclavibacter helvolus]
MAGSVTRSASRPASCIRTLVFASLTSNSLRLKPAFSWPTSPSCDMWFLPLLRRSRESTRSEGGPTACSSMDARSPPRSSPRELTCQTTRHQKTPRRTTAPSTTRSGTTRRRPAIGLRTSCRSGRPRTAGETRNGLRTSSARPSARPRRRQRTHTTHPARGRTATPRPDCQTRGARWRSSTHWSTATRLRSHPALCSLGPVRARNSPSPSTPTSTARSC